VTLVGAIKHELLLTTATTARLAASTRAIGRLHPIVTSTDGQPIAEERRLLTCKALHRKTHDEFAVKRRVERRGDELDG
jgi:hypothetical protein